MKKSNLDVVFTEYGFNKLCIDYKKKYKEENGTPFKGNVLVEVTINVLYNTGFPNNEDIIRLIIAGKGYEEDAVKKAYDFLEQVKQREEYKERGKFGIFCDLCRDAHIDLNMNKQFIEVIDYFEKQILEKLENTTRKNNWDYMLEQLQKFSESLGTVDKEQETAEADTVE